MITRDARIKEAMKAAQQFVPAIIEADEIYDVAKAVVDALWPEEASS